MSQVAIIAAVLALFLAFNIITVLALVRLHPRRRAMVIALAVVGNVMWVFFPLLNARTDFSRLVRAIFGPPWFAWLCFVIVYSLLIAVVGLVARRHLRLASRIFLWTTLVALIAGIYAALVPLRVERVPIALTGLPAALDGFRIVEIADLHTGLFTRPSRLRTIFAAADALHPDVVILAGDLIDDDPFYISKLLAATGSLSPSTPLIAVLGNHEMYGQPLEVIEKLHGTRVQLLVNQGTAFKGLWLAGISDYAARTPELRPDLGRALALGGSNFPVVIAHQPKAFDDAIRLKMPLTICAHTHGGQCGFRPLGLSLAGLFVPYHMGLYRRGGSQLYVNTGTGYWLLPWRLGITSEITLIELRRR